MSMFFISHSSKDTVAANDMKERLLRQGYAAAQIFLDSDTLCGIEAGANWEQVLFHRLTSCRVLIALCTSNWEASKWCFAEFIHAKATGKHVFPILLEACDVGETASAYQAISVYLEGEAAFERLWATLKSRRLSPENVAESIYNLFGTNGSVVFNDPMILAMGAAYDAARSWQSTVVGVPHLLAGMASIPDGLLATFLRRYSLAVSTWMESLRSTIRASPAALDMPGQVFEPTETVRQVVAMAKQYLTPGIDELNERAILRAVFSVRATYLDRLAKMTGLPLSDLGESLVIKTTPFQD